jgi:hypothetical protein
MNHTKYTKRSSKAFKEVRLFDKNYVLRKRGQPDWCKPAHCGGQTQNSEIFDNCPNLSDSLKIPEFLGMNDMSPL